MADLADEEDHRVRGAFVFAGGAATGRASSYGLQVHNFARKTAKEPEAVRHAMVRGHQIVPAYGKRVTDVLKGMLRPSLMAAPKRKLVTADWSAIEARVNPWLSNCPSGDAKLDLFRTGEDIYKVNASATFGVGVADVDDAQRQVGKVQELACLSEDTLVLTICGEKAIQDVRAGDLVWDGVSWVFTDGAVFKGERHVIEYDGLCATPDHLVWVEGATDAIEFGRAAADGLRLVRARAPNEAAVPVTCEATDGSETAVREPEVKGLQILRSEGCVVRLPYGGERLCVGAGEHRPAAGGYGVGSDGQQQKLRSREPALVNQGAEPQAYVDLCECVGATCFPANAPRGEVRRQHDEKPAVDGPDLSADRGEVGASELQTKRRVWDLLNCGPLHRFTASGRLVHNCGFGGSVGAFNAMGRIYGVVLPEAQSRRMVDAWRRANPWAVDQWSALERAYTIAMRQPGHEFTAGRVTYLYDRQHLWYALPSGRVLCYPHARFERDGITYAKAAWKPAQDAKEWPRARLWHGLACENIVQAVANDLLRDALRRLDAAGQRVILHVHDEIVLEADDVEAAAAQLEAVMVAPPAWAAGLPLAAEVNIRERYGK
jgi:DNA polymerase